MENPYDPPKTESKVTEQSPNKARFAAPLLGCGLGGCLGPILLFFVGAFLGDTGGPLIWPMLAISLGVIGFVIGVIYQIWN